MLITFLLLNLVALVYCALVLRSLTQHATDIFNLLSELRAVAVQHDTREDSRDKIRSFMSNGPGRDLLRQRLAERLKG